MFTLSGGHLFVLYDGAVQNGDLRLIDTRHEQTAVFAAEGWAKVTRRLGCAAITAGPGVTNGVSAMTAAWMNGSPVVVLAGRAPQLRWGSGSLQELDHVPIVASDHEAGRHRDVGRVDRGGGRGRVPRGDHAAPRQHVRRHPARRVRAGRRGAAERRGGDRGAQRRIPTRSPASRSWSPTRSGRCSSRAVTCTGPAPSTRCARSWRRRASPRSSTAWGAARCRPITSSRSHGRARSR